MEYPRAQQALIVDAATGSRREITAGETGKALQYELEDMERAILSGNASCMRLNHTADVMELMTFLRKKWNMRYPDEIW